VNNDEAKLLLSSLFVKEDRDKRDLRFLIVDCAHVKSALPFHIRENLTGQGFWIFEKQKAEGICDSGKAKGRKDLGKAKR